MSTEVLALIGTIVTLVGGGVGFFTKWALGQSDKRVEAAEKREAEANARAKEERDVQNKRIDLLTDGVNAQSKTIADLSSALKTMGEGIKAMGDGNREDLKKVHDGMATLLARTEHSVRQP